MSTLGEAGEASLDVVSDPLAGAADRNRAAGRMALATVVSRGSGFVRTITVAAVLGATYLGNTYQSTNAIPNLVFELVVAGALQAVLVPVVVERLDRGRDDATRAASAVLGATTAVLGVLAVVGVLLAPWIVRGLTVGVDDPAVRNQQIALGTLLLWCFLPQVVFYGLNLVATALLNASGRFSLPALAPTVNNVVVVGAYLLFARMRGGAPPSLDLSLPEALVLGLGTTLGVVAFCVVPFIGARRAGFDLRLRWEPRHPAVSRVVRQGAWAGGYLAASQVVLVVMLVLANSVEGGVVVQQLAYVLFLLPVSLLAVPFITTAFPTLTRLAGRSDWSAYRSEVARTARLVLLSSAVALVVLVAAREVLAELVSLGNAAVATEEVARAIAGFALGLPGFAAVLLLTRASYARGEVRSPTVVACVVALVAAIAATVLARNVPADWRIAAIGAGHALAQSVGAFALVALLGRDLRRGGTPPSDGPGMQRAEDLERVRRP